ncbi:hypothetical protein K501DRAFT_265063 [Backusella circina FSU 941]|nr:hypothetical protein K501DRAFT_265063 [Backusella circina FSU 941]
MQKKYSKFERIKSYIDSITPEIIQELDVYKLHEKELTDLLVYEKEIEPLNKHISKCLLKESKKKKGWIGRLRHWIKFHKDPKRSPCSWSASKAQEKDKQQLDMINILDIATSKEFVDGLEYDKIRRRPSLYNPRIASVPIERQPKFSPNTKGICHVRTSKSSRQVQA